MNSARIAVFAIAALTLPACPESADIATADLRAVVDITVSEDSAKVLTRLYEKDDSFSAELSGGDRLVVSANGGKQLEMDAAITDYSADLPLDARDVRVTLLRESGESAFIEEQVPDRLLLDATAFSFADDTITINWSNPIDGAVVALLVDSCADISIETPESKEPVPDTGSYTLTRAEIEQEAGGIPDCAVLVIARRRSNQGASGGFYSSSVIRAVRKQREEIQLTP